MRAFNVEFFDRSYNFITNQMTSDFSYTFDYLSQTSNVISLKTDNLVGIGQFVRISGGPKEIYGVVSAIDRGSGNGKLMNVSYNPLTSLLSTDVLFDTDLQGSDTPLETVIANFIRDLYVNNGDTLQNISGLTVRVTSTTEDWGFNLKSTNEGMHHTIIDFWDSIIARALEKYQIVVDMRMNVGAKTITCTVGKNTEARQVIEADLPNIVERNIVEDASNESANKAVIYNGNNYSQRAVYYRHPDGTFDTQNRARLTPVLRVADEVLVEEGQTFAKAAQSKAGDILGQAAYNNLIELRVLMDDDLVKAGTIDIGQVVTIITNGVSYTSILSGYLIDTMMTLTFGIIRLDLTKQLRR